MKNLSLTFFFILITILSFGQVRSDYYYNIYLAGNKQNVDVKNARYYNGAKLQFCKHNGHDAQKFRFIPAGQKGVYYIHPKGNNKLYLAGNTNKNAGGVYLKKKSTSDSQQWSIKKVSGKYYIQNRRHRNYLSFIWGNHLGVWSKLNTTAQGWTFKPAGKVKTTTKPSSSRCTTKACRDAKKQLNIAKQAIRGIYKKVYIGGRNFKVHNIRQGDVSKQGSKTIIKRHVSFVQNGLDGEIHYTIVVSGNKSYVYIRRIRNGGIKDVIKLVAGGAYGFASGCALAGAAGTTVPLLGTAAGCVAGGAMGLWLTNSSASSAAKRWQDTAMTIISCLADEAARKY